MPFGQWEKFLLLMGGGLAVIVTVAVVACFVGPGCWGFEYLQREKKKKKNKNIKKLSDHRVVKKTSTNLEIWEEKGIENWTPEAEYVVYQAGPYGLEKKIGKAEGIFSYTTKEKGFNLKCAPLLIPADLHPVIKNSAPRLEIRLCQSCLEKDDIMARLSVHIISVSSLVCREYIPTLDPYVTLHILNNRWSLQKNENQIHCVQTRVIKNCLNPKFDQIFYFDAKKTEMKLWCLRFTICDNDRFAKGMSLFEKTIYLKDLKNLRVNEEISISLEMEDLRRNIGAILFGITYLPTSQKLNVTVIKTSKLKFKSYVSSLLQFNPFVRVIMLNKHGKCLKKQKTTSKEGDNCPVFNQSLIFDLSISSLEQTVFLIQLCLKLSVSNSDSSSQEGDGEICSQKTRNKVLGTVVLGRNVKCSRARDHWVAVMVNPRKMISVWHDLN